MLQQRLVTLDVIGQLVTLSECEAEGLRRALRPQTQGGQAPGATLSLLLDRGLQTHTTVVLDRAEARELAERLDAGGSRANFALLQEALRGALS